MSGFRRPSLSVRRPALLSAAALSLLSVAPVLRAQQEGAARPATAPSDVEVTVTATRTERTQLDTPGSVSVQRAVDFERNNVTELSDLVRNETDVAVPRAFGGTGPVSRTRPGALNFNIRGIDGNRILFQVDGIRQPDQFTFGNTTTIGRDYLDLANYKRLEIVKGAASALYGSDAIGGVVSFVTLDPSDILGVVSNRPFAFRLRAGYDGFDDSHYETLTAAWRIGRLELLAQYTRRDGNEVDSKGEALLNTRGDRGENPLVFHTDSVLAKAVYRWNESNVTKLTGEYLTRQTDFNLINARRTTSVVTAGIPTFTDINNVPASDHVESFRISLDHSYVKQPAGGLSKDSKGKAVPAASAGWEDAWLAAADFKVYYQGARDGESAREDRVSRRAGRADQAIVQFRTFRYEQNLVGGNVQLQTRLTLGPTYHHFTYGVDVQASEISRDRDGTQINYTLGTTTNFLNPDTFPVKDIPDTDILRVGGYFQDEISFGRDKIFTIIPAVRVDYYRAESTVDPIYLRTSGGQFPIDYEKTSVTPKVAALFKITPRLTLSGQYSRGFRNPTPEDLNGTVTNLQFFYRTIANPGLKSETSDNFDLTLRGDLPGLKFLVSGYYNRYRNFINTFANAGIDANGLTLFQSQNIGKAEIYGVEAKAETPLGYWAPSLEGFAVGASLGYSHGEDETSNRPLNSIQPLKTNLQLRYDAPNGRWGVAFNAAFISRQNRVDFVSSPGQFIPDSAQVLDITAYANVTKNVRVNVGVYNLANEKFWYYQDVIGLPGNRIDIGRFAQPGTHVKANVSLTF